MPGYVWKYTAAIGDTIAAGDTVAVIDSMKMEMAVTSLVAGILRETRAEPGRTVRAGDIIAVIEV